MSKSCKKNTNCEDLHFPEFHMLAFLLSRRSHPEMPWSPRNQKCLQHAPSLLFHPTTASWSFPPNPFFELRLINIFDTEIIFSPVPSPLLWILTPFSRHDKYIHNSLWDRFAFSFCCTSSICNFLAPSSFKREIPPHSYPHPSH